MPFSLTKTNAKSGRGATVPPTTAATVPSAQVMSAAKPSAVNGDDITTGNCNAISTPHITMMPNTISSVSTIDYEMRIKMCFVEYIGEEDVNEKFVLTFKQKNMEKRHVNRAVVKPDTNNDLRRRCRYRV